VEGQPRCIRGEGGEVRLTLDAERLGVRPDSAATDFESGEPVERDGVAYTRLRVPVDDDTLAGLKKGVSHCSVTVWLDATDMPEHGSMFYRAPVDGEERLAETRAPVVERGNLCLVRPAPGKRDAVQVDDVAPTESF